MLINGVTWVLLPPTLSTNSAFATLMGIKEPDYKFQAYHAEEEICQTSINWNEFSLPNAN